jgi:FdhD protein
MKPVQQTRAIYRFAENQLRQQNDVVVTEYALTIKVNGDEFATVVCTPEYMEDMVIGFLASEGIIRELADIQELYIQERLGIAQVTVKEMNQLYQKFRSKRYITSCCGMSRQGFYFVNDAMTAKTINGVHIRLSAAQIFTLMKQMQKGAELFLATGGVHTAALCDEQQLLVARIDIGRHNALDKIYGHCLQSGIAMTGKALVFSGRISSEILLKASKIGCEMILSKSAPTELALQMAEQLGITTVGFIRGQSFNVYTHPERIKEYA